MPPTIRSPPEERVIVLRQLFDELPSQRLPETKMLADADWLAIARKHGLGSSADIRIALAELRSIARIKFAKSLQATIRRYTAGSGGELPADLTQLAPLLAAPANAEMLARYDLLRTGKLGDSAEKLVREKSTSDLILTF